MADAYGLDENQVFACGVQKTNRGVANVREAAVDSPCRETSDKNVAVKVMGLHADAVAQHRASAERARGVHSQDSDTQPLAPRHRDQRVHQRAFARAGRAGDSDAISVSGVGMNLTHDIAEVVVAALDAGEEAGQRTAVAGQRFLHKLVQSCVHGVECQAVSRARIRFAISTAPTPAW